jgi:hypothetical protein
MRKITGKAVQKENVHSLHSKGVRHKSRSFPQFPQSQSSSISKIVSPSYDCDERGGNVEKWIIPQGAKTLRGGKECGWFFENVENCRRQVYTCQEVAERTAGNLGRFGVPAVVIHCPVCGRVHIGLKTSK